LIAALSVGASPGAAQGNEIPSVEYYACYGPYWEGRYTDAGKAFRDAFSIKGVNGRWVDAIPQYTMEGECHYQLGNHNEALEAYTTALRLYLGFPDFLLRVEWSGKETSTGTVPRGGLTVSPVRIPWGNTAPIRRGAYIGDFPPSEKLIAGKVIATGKIVIDTRSIKSVNVQEITRTLAIAIRRYGELKGPTAKFDPLLREVVTALSKGGTKARHWSGSLIDVLLGCAYRAAGEAGAEERLRIGTFAAGEYEHPLTAIALLELGHLALAEGKYVDAGNLFEQATYAAMHFSERGPCTCGTPDVLEEAFRYGFIAHRLAGHGKPFLPAQAAADWAVKQRNPSLTVLHASLLLDLAESNAALRNPAGADSKGLAPARQLIYGKARNDLPRSRLAARHNHVEALVRYQQVRIGDGDSAMASAMDFQRRGSLWLYHIALADRLALQPPAGVSARDAIQLYEKVLRDPTAADWQLQPLESLSALMGPRGIPMEHWFLAALSANRAGGLPALEIADLVRRHRFTGSLEFGGRLVSLRCLLEGPPELLDKVAAQQRQNLLASYPEFDKLSKQVALLKTELRRIPLVVDAKSDASAADEQRKKLAEIARLSSLQEVMLRQMAVDRVFVPALFPPQRSAKEVQESLDKKQALLVFFATTPTVESPGRIFTFLLTSDKAAYPTWAMAEPDNVIGSAAKMLREMGHFARDREIPLAKLRATEWQTRGAEVFKGLFTSAPGGTPEAIPAATEELVIVPDAAFWYVPFEALQVPAAAGKTQSLISKYRVRYAPTMSLAVPDKIGRKTGGNLAVAVGQLMPGKGHDARARAAFDEINRVMPTAVQLTSPLPAPSSVYGTLFDRLLVLDDIDGPATHPLGWRPIGGRTTAAERLASPLLELRPLASEGWLNLPWGGPDQVILPGFHTPAEHGLSDREKNGSIDGMDVFRSVCGLMAAGSRTILLSRWRTGGKTSFDLTREFAQELPQSSASQAWQRAVLLCTEAPLVPDQEPRVAWAAGAGAINASHPFFWSGYMLVDTGIQPPAAATDPPAKPAVRAAALKVAQ
jgi:tetratricopeptide (TPR) repeat protein